jgi:aubergine-like protein
MVNKRVKTKMISETNGRLNNPVPGTVLDHSITAKDLQDFYIVTTTSRQGLPTPSHFSVLLNEINATPEQIQALTFKLCYTYYNYGGPVKIPSPVKYADKLAGMVGELGGITPHIRHESNKALYFI